MDPVTRDLLLAQDGDHQALARFVNAAEPDVRRFCSWFTRPGAEIDDVVQETFLRALRGLNSFGGRSTATAWLLTVARRVCLDLADRKRRDAALERTLIATSTTVADPGVDVAGHLLIANLPDEFRAAFVLVKILGFTYDEAAEILGCPRGTIQSRVARARVALASSIWEPVRSDVG